MSNEPASAPCYANEVDDAYMGYSPRDEILAALNAFLETERAVMKSALATARQASNSALAGLMRTVGTDAAHGCAILRRRIRWLGGTPSRRACALQDRALARADPHERLSVLIRGQTVLVRRLEALLPRLRQEGLSVELRVLADTHRGTINAAEAVLKGNPPVRD